MAVTGTVSHVAVSQGGAGTTAVVAAPGAGLRVVLHGALLVMDLAGTAKFQSAATDLTGAMSLATSSPLGVALDSDCVLRCAANEALNLTTATGAAKGVVWYSVESTS